MTTVNHAERGAPGDWKTLHGGGALIAPAHLKAWASVVLERNSSIRRLVPVGYEDEAGFHYGDMPATDASPGFDESAFENQ
jgi:hypothetical protein